MQKLDLIKNLFFASSCFITCYAMDTAASYLDVVNASLTNSFQLHLQKDIDLNDYSANILEETQKIDCNTWRNAHPTQKKIYGFFFLLKKANASFLIKNQTRSGNIITTHLEQLYNYDQIATTYKKISAVTQVINSSGEGNNELNSTLGREKSSFTSLQG